jgi:hypothetical protein
VVEIIFIFLDNFGMWDILSLVWIPCFYSGGFHENARREFFSRHEGDRYPIDNRRQVIRRPLYGGRFYLLIFLDAMEEPC